MAFFLHTRRWVTRAAALLLILSLCATLAPRPAQAWGATAHRLITSKAIETLPPELRPFFESSRNELARHCVTPMEWAQRDPEEQHNQRIQLEKYGPFPFDALPRDYRVASRKLGERNVRANGVLPWQIGIYQERLTKAFKAGEWAEARELAAVLAYYVARAHDPFSTTENHDGILSGQPGVNRRFSTQLVDRFSAFFFIRPNEAVYLADPTDHAFEMTMSAHSWLEKVLLSDRRAQRGLTGHNDEYYDRFYNQAGAILIREITDAATDVGSYWLTAWINAGRPALPSN